MEVVSFHIHLVIFLWNCTLWWCYMSIPLAPISFHLNATSFLPSYGDVCLLLLKWILRLSYSIEFICFDFFLFEARAGGFSSLHLIYSRVFLKKKSPFANGDIFSITNYWNVDQFWRFLKWYISYEGTRGDLSWCHLCVKVYRFLLGLGTRVFTEFWAFRVVYCRSPVQPTEAAGYSCGRRESLIYETERGVQ